MTPPSRVGFPPTRGSRKVARSSPLSLSVPSVTFKLIAPSIQADIIVLLPVSSASFLVGPDRSQEVDEPECGPEDVHEDELGVRPLPEQEPAHPLLPRSP